MKFYTEQEALDKVIGKEGTSERIEYNAQMNEYLRCEVIRQARQKNH